MDMKAAITLFAALDALKKEHGINPPYLIGVVIDHEKGSTGLQVKCGDKTYVEVINPEVTNPFDLAELIGIIDEYLKNDSMFFVTIGSDV